jgi:catechol 2,3-dioxygenase-like lactoylglutathione lyase family enzyme
MAIPFVQRVFPTLRIRDAAEAQAFYVEQLGFRIDWRWRDERGRSAFMQVSRDGLALYLSERVRDCEAGGLVYLYVQDVDAWESELRARGVALDEEARDQPWGNREMRLRDPSGNRLCIATVLTPAPDPARGARP